MKYKRLAVFLENKSGGFYQVVLKQDEMDMVADLILKIHNGKIKIRNEKYDCMFFDDKK